MTGVGSYLLASHLRHTNVSDIRWQVDGLSQAIYVRNKHSGLMLAYISFDMLTMTAFTPESMLWNWIWRVCNRCLRGPVDQEPLLVLRNQK